jgi:Na+-transporting NADH:ubiquinone oxidoreductase subunit B
LSILLFNVFAPIIDHLVIEQHIKSRLKNAQ